MGRGSAYSYEFFMLIDTMHRYFYEDYEDGEEFSEIIWDDFIEIVKEKMNLEETDYFLSGEKITLGQFCDDESLDTIFIGMDSSGGLPCIFAVPEYDSDESEMYEYEYEESYESYKERIREKVNMLFNKLIEEFPDGLFRYPTTAWTSHPYTKENKYAY